MAKTETYSVYDVDYTLEVPTTEAEYNAKAGPARTNACVEDAVDHTVFHVTNGRIRAKVAELIEAGCCGTEKADDKGVVKGDPAKAFPRIKADKAKNVKEETYGAHFDRWLESDSNTLKDMGAALVLLAATLCPFDPSVRARAAGGPKGVAKQYTLTAQQLFTEKADKVQAICAKLLEMNPATKFTLESEDPAKIEKTKDGVYTVAGLARLISENEARLRREANLSKKYASVEEIA